MNEKLCKPHPFVFHSQLIVPLYLQTNMEGRECRKRGEIRRKTKKTKTSVNTGSPNSYKIEKLMQKLDVNYNCTWV